MKDWSMVEKIINRNESFVVATHVMPDGDGIGSLLALSHTLRKLGKNVFPTWGSKIDVPAQYSFLPGLNGLVEPADLPKSDLGTIVLDCASIERLGVLVDRFRIDKDSINIDHHQDNKGFGVVNIIRKEASSTCEIIYDLIKHMLMIKKETIDKDIAICLYTGIVTDTGRFQYSSTTKETFRIAGELLDLGVDPSFIFKNVYEKQELGRLKLFGHAFIDTKMLEDIGLVYTVIDPDSFKKTNTNPEDSESLIDALRSVKGVQVAVLFKPGKKGEELRVSMRSTGHADVAKIAGIYGGGGHKLAAGFSSNKSLEEVKDSLFIEVRKVLGSRRTEKE